MSSSSGDNWANIALGWLSGLPWWAALAILLGGFIVIETAYVFLMNWANKPRR